MATNNLMDEVNGTLTITNKNTNVDIILYGKVMDINPDNPMTVEVLKDNLTDDLGGDSFAYFNNSQESSKLVFNCVNLDPKNHTNVLKGWFTNKESLSLIFVSGSDSNVSYQMGSCYLQKEPMNPRRSSDWKTELSFVGSKIIETFE